MPSDVTQAREHLLAALEADLVGPYEKPGGLDVSDELLKLPPSRWYLTGFLAPMEARALPDPVQAEGAVAAPELVAIARSADPESSPRCGSH